MYNDASIVSSATSSCMSCLNIKPCSHTAWQFSAERQHRSCLAAHVIPRSIVGFCSAPRLHCPSSCASKCGLYWTQRSLSQHGSKDEQLFHIGFPVATTIAETIQFLDAVSTPDLSATSSSRPVVLRLRTRSPSRFFSHRVVMTD